MESDLAALLDASFPQGPLYVHFDSDILDPSEAPAMNYPAPGGPSSETLRHVFRRLAATGRIAAVSLSAWNPDMDEDRASRDLIMGLLAELVV
ncbi:MAG: arginase family protein [Chloroflexota bacterium]|nr:MAG: arginase family protein [Chloroflexota bacterium]